MPKSTAADLLVKLSSDPALRRRFQENPSAVLDEAGIEGADRDVPDPYHGDDDGFTPTELLLTAIHFRPPATRTHSSKATLKA